MKGSSPSYLASRPELEKIAASPLRIMKERKRTASFFISKVCFISFFLRGHVLHGALVPPEMVGNFPTDQTTARLMKIAIFPLQSLAAAAAELNR